MSSIQTTDRVDSGSAAAEAGLYETADFYLACFLRCSGYELTGMRRQGRRYLFVYRDQPGRPQATMAFYGDRTSVRPLRFVSVIKEMKALLHNVQDEDRRAGAAR